MHGLGISIQLSLGVAKYSDNVILNRIYCLNLILIKLDNLQLSVYKSMFLIAICQLFIHLPISIYIWTYQYIFEHCIYCINNTCIGPVGLFTQEFPRSGSKAKTKKERDREKDRKLVITMASYALQRHLGWRIQSRLGQKSV